MRGGGFVHGWMDGCVWVMERREEYSIGRGKWRRLSWRFDADGVGCIACICDDRADE